jgi:internalin A
MAKTNKTNKTIQQLIADVKENNLTKLNFGDSYEKFEELPDEVYELTSIEELHLGSNQIKNISKKIIRLNKLKIFRASNSDFEKFPLELMEVSSLTKIFIGSKNILELPEMLNHWDNLTYLNLGGSEKLEYVRGLPPNLDYLYIAGPSLLKLPENLFTLSKLTKLVIQKIQLGDFPIKLLEMTSLCNLYIIDCKLKSIPDEIVKLSYLDEIILSNNEFKDFPEAITNLSKLKEIMLDGNYLQQIPSNILKLKSLEKIDLSRNNFMYIQNILFEMTNLKKIDFGNYRGDIGESKPFNSIKNIPDELLKLDQLEVLDLFENPIENVPAEILREGIKAIKNYIRSRVEADTEEFLYEAKMVMVGRGNVGKTVLTKKLTDPNYVLSQSKTTHGIAVLKNPFLFPVKSFENDYDFKFNIWDFGGQEKYDATHQLFIPDGGKG